MGALSFDDFQTQIGQHFQNGEYVEVLDLATRAADRFPEQAPQFYYWRTCAASRIGQTQVALQLFEEALASGLWFGESLLRHSPSYQSLQGLPEFERLVDAFREKTSGDRPEAVTVLPDSAPQPWPALIALQQNSGTAQGAAGYWRSVVSRGWLLTLPQSSQARWAGSYVWDDQDIARRDAQSHFAAVRQQHPIDADRVIVAGHSMGGQVAIRLVLSGAIKARGFIAVGPWLPDLNGFRALMEKRRGSASRGYILFGKKDDSIPHDSIYLLAEMLKSHNIACQVEAHPDAGHEFPPDFEHRLNEALDFVLQD